MLKFETFRYYTAQSTVTKYFFLASEGAFVTENCNFELSGTSQKRTQKRRNKLMLCPFSCCLHPTLPSFFVQLRRTPSLSLVGIFYGNPPYRTNVYKIERVFVLLYQTVFLLHQIVCVSIVMELGYMYVRIPIIHIPMYCINNIIVIIWKHCKMEWWCWFYYYAELKYILHLVLFIR